MAVRRASQAPTREEYVNDIRLKRLGNCLLNGIVSINKFQVWTMKCPIKISYNSGFMKSSQLRVNNVYMGSNVMSVGENFWCSLLGSVSKFLIGQFLFASIFLASNFDSTSSCAAPTSCFVSSHCFGAQFHILLLSECWSFFLSIEHFYASFSGRITLCLSRVASPEL